MNRTTYACIALAHAGDRILVRGVEYLVMVATPGRLTVRNCGHDFVTTIKR